MICPVRIHVFCYDCSLRSAAITACALNALFVASFFFVGMANIGVGIQLAVNQNDQEKIGKVIGSGIGFLICTSITLTILILFVKGIAQSKAQFLLPWLIGEMASIFLQGIGIVTTIVIIFDYRLPIFLPALCFQGLYMAFDVYLWIAVHNYYLELKENPVDATQSPVYPLARA